MTVETLLARLKEYCMLRRDFPAAAILRDAAKNMKDLPNHTGREEKTMWDMESLALSSRGKLALQMIERWGSVAGVPDEAEDSTGRSKLRLQTPSELVDRACAVADKAFDEFKNRGWLPEGNEVSDE